jgi:anti-sigma B factor antagonist
MPAVRYPIEMVRGVPVVAAPEEIDASNADGLRTTLLETAARGHATFVVDMTRTRFCASAGVGALVRAHQRALAEGGELRLLMPASTAMASAFALTGTDHLIPTFTDLDEALESAPAATRPQWSRRRSRPGNVHPRGPVAGRSWR